MSISQFLRNNCYQIILIHNYQELAIWIFNFQSHLAENSLPNYRVTDSRFSKTWNLEVLILKSWNLESRLDNSRFQDFKITASRFQVFKIDIFCYFQTFLTVLKRLYLSQPREQFTYFAIFCQLFPKMTSLKFVKLKNFL